MLFKSSVESAYPSRKFHVYWPTLNIYLREQKSLTIKQTIFYSSFFILFSLFRGFGVLGVAKFISVTCDSTSMISEAALTGKPLYIAEIPAKKNDYRFKKFRDLFSRLNITKNLNEKLETWHYESLNETIRIAEEIKKKLNNVIFKIYWN